MVTVGVDNFPIYSLVINC